MIKAKYLLFTLIFGIVLIWGSCKEDEETNIIGTETSTVTDIDGNTYKTVKIGFQWWMAENLKVTRYRNGDTIPEVKDNDDWKKLRNGAWCNYDNNSANDSIYGKLYNHYAIGDSRNICPEGWHIPTNSEWSAMEMTVGRTNMLGGKLKEKDTLHWKAPNTGATNETGFTALPGGIRTYYGGFDGLSFNGYWWTSSSVNDTVAWYRYLYYSVSTLDGDAQQKYFGYSIRCVKD